MSSIDITLFVDMQDTLDQAIKKKRNLDGPLVHEKILALNVEIGELAQEWGIFKYWRVNPITKNRENMIEEYVDVFHFILSLIVEKVDIYPSLRNLVIEYPEDGEQHNKESITRLFNELFEATAYLADNYPFNYKLMITLYFQLGYELGIEFEEVIQAYIQKNLTNHERLKNGY